MVLALPAFATLTFEPPSSSAENILASGCVGICLGDAAAAILVGNFTVISLKAPLLGKNNVCRSIFS